MAKDPVCGMEVLESTGKITHYHKGKMYYFCAPGCKEAFKNEPDKFLKGGPVGMMGIE